MERDRSQSSSSTPKPKLQALSLDDDDANEDISDTDSLVTIDFPTKSDLYTIRNGRRHQALNEDAYSWAVDGVAAKLELLLASVLALTFPNGLCFEPSPGALAEVLGLGEGRILDVGSGVVGEWAIKMGERFPRSKVIGVDLVPSETEFAPSNVSFQVHDISERLPYPDQSFSLIHFRGLSVAALALLSEVARCLIPGGVLLICEPNNLLSSRTPNNPSVLQQALARRERDQPSYLDAVRQRWFQEIAFRVKNHGMFEVIVDHWDEIGVGTREGGPLNESKRGAYMREACLAIWNLETSDEDMDEQTRAPRIASDRELIPPQDVGLYVQFRSVWARRCCKAEDGAVGMSMDVQPCCCVRRTRRA